MVETITAEDMLNLKLIFEETLENILDKRTDSQVRARFGEILSLLQSPENRIKFNSISKEIVYSGCDYWEAMNGYVYFFAKTIDGVPTFFLLNEINNERFIEKNQKIYNEIVILLGELNN
jgi:hypothetical protein